MYIPDGSTQDYDKGGPANRYSWGWLGDKVPIEKTGWKDSGLKSRVVSLLHAKKNDYIVMHHMGSHDCEVCGKSKPKKQYQGNGSFLITHAGLEFRCPAGVIHYIEEHDYNPGYQVIEALFEGRWKTGKQEDEELEECMERWHEERRLEAEEKERNMTPMERKRRDFGNAAQAAGRKKLAQLRKDGALVK